MTALIKGDTGTDDHRIFLIFFVNSLQQQIASQLTTYVTSSFQQQGLTATTGIVANLIAGIVKFPTAKLMDIWGRPQGYVAMLLCAVIGMKVVGLA